MARKKNNSTSSPAEWTRSATRTSAPTSPPRNCATSWPTTRPSRRRCSIRATRRSTRSSSGRARTSRTGRPSRSVVPIYIQEKIQPQRIIEDRPARKPTKPDSRLAARLFADFNGMEFDRKVDFYQHDQNWANRMILGDSLLVMTSLAEKEGLKGKVQMIYIDPPYGIKFGSNWQVSSTRKRDVKDGKVEDATRQPEQIRAFRDTWELGIHSYLAYLRDRLSVARELLTETGQHLRPDRRRERAPVPSMLDEVFGAENFVSQIIVLQDAAVDGDGSCRIPPTTSFGTRKTPNT